MTDHAPQALAADFPRADRDDWLALVDKVLKGAPFDRTLVSRTYDGIEIQPLYRPGAADRPVAPRPVDDTGRDGGWDICTRIDAPQPAVAAQLALADLEGGATSLELALDVGGVGDVDGVVVGSVDDLDAALDGVLLDLASIRLDAGPQAAHATDLLREVWDRREIAADVRRGSLGHDPLGALAALGVLPQGLDAALAEMARDAAATSPSPGIVPVTVDTTPYAAAGASEGQEIGAALATNAVYLRTLLADGADVDEAAAAIEVVVAADADIYATIAKIRALRVCRAHLLEVSGAADPLAPLEVTVRTNPSALTDRDVWVNLLRVTAGCFAAAVGGAQRVITAPFDQPLGAADALARRMARNTQLILAEESDLGRVVDPAGGSFYVEQLTDDIVDAGWAEFVAIETSGGMPAALADGSLRGRVADASAQRRGRIATRRDPITGLSEFPHLDEERLQRPDPDRAAVREAVDAPAPPSGPPTVVEPFVSQRRGADYEKLRNLSDRLEKEQGARPSIFSANLGPIAAHTARASFARNLFEAGGVAVVGNDGFADDASLVEAFGSTDTEMAVICGSDAIYAERAAATAAALKGAGAVWVALAGAPGDAEADLRAAGVDQFVHLGVDVIDAVTAALDATGVVR